MKKIMFALSFVLGGFMMALAQDTTGYQPGMPGDQMEQQDRERISATELPDQVKRQLEGQDFSGWLISGAFRYTGDVSTLIDTTGMGQQGGIGGQPMEDREIFIVELKNGAETKTVWFDENGEELEGVGEQGQMGQPGDIMQPDPNMPDPGMPDPNMPDPNMPDPSLGEPTQPDPTMPDPSMGEPTPPEQPEPVRPDNQYQDEPYQPGQPDPNRPDGGTGQYEPAPAPGQPQTDPTQESGTPQPSQPSDTEQGRP